MYFTLSLTNILISLYVKLSKITLADSLQYHEKCCDVLLVVLVLPLSPMTLQISVTLSTRLKNNLAQFEDASKIGLPIYLRTPKALHTCHNLQPSRVTSTALPLKYVTIFRMSPPTSVTCNSRSEWKLPDHLPTLSTAKASAAPTSASECWRYRNEPWTGLDTNTH